MSHSPLSVANKLIGTVALVHAVTPDVRSPYTLYSWTFWNCISDVTSVHLHLTHGFLDPPEPPYKTTSVSFGLAVEDWMIWFAVYCTAQSLNIFAVGRPSPKTVISGGGIETPPIHPNSHARWHLHRFSRFCTVHLLSEVPLQIRWNAVKYNHG